MIVFKDWGYEEWIVNKEYCGKRLYVKANHRCSLHYHKIKDETFYINKGLIVLELGFETYIVKQGQSVHIPIGTKHRFTALEDSEIIEFSTHHEDSDSIRLVIGGIIEKPIVTNGIPYYETKTSN